jgi:hypothetical protein
VNYPSQITLVKLIKLKRTQTVCTEKERMTEKTERKQSFLIFFLKIHSRQKKFIKNKKNALTPGFQDWGALSPW